MIAVAFGAVVAAVEVYAPAHKSAQAAASVAPAATCAAAPLHC